MKRMANLIFFLFLLNPLAANLIHTFSDGDSIATVAEKYGVTAKRLRTVNNLPRDGEPQIGDTVVIPRHYQPVFIKLASQGSNSDQPDQFASNTNYAALKGLTNLLGNDDRTTTKKEVTSITLTRKDLLKEAYSVQAGESLSGISQRKK